MADGSAGLPADHLGHLVERHRLGSGERVDPAAGRHGGQRGHGGSGDVPGIDHRHPPVAGGGGDRAVTHHREQVLHEEHRPQHGVLESGVLQGPFRPPVLAGDLQRGASHRPGTPTA